MASFTERLRNSWNAFRGRNPTDEYVPRNLVVSEVSSGSYMRPDRHLLTRGLDRSIVNTIYNQLATDISMINIQHVKLDDEGKFTGVIDDDLNRILTREANIDQTGREFIKDLAYSMFDEGCVALIPTFVDGENPITSEAYVVLNSRVGRVVEWYPYDVKIEVYDEITGRRQQTILPKSIVPIIENPFYSIMNSPNGTLQRLVRVLNQIDRVNEQNSAGKLDLIIQLPYTIRSEGRRVQAEERRKKIEAQLVGSQYGIAYADATEKITQLNRPVENNLWQQAQDLKVELFNQLGLAESIFNGTADEATLLNYYNRTIDPCMAAITENIERKWLSKTAISQKQAIRYFRDPFKLVPVQNLAEIADKFTRNEIMSSNEFRAVIGLKPDSNAKSDQLINSNLNHTPEEQMEIEGEAKLNEIIENLKSK